MVATIEDFHEIVFFPMIYQGETSFIERVDGWKCWQEDLDFHKRKDGLPEAGGMEFNLSRADVARYGEHVFYHPFVQRFLYGNQNAGDNVRVWQRQNGPQALQLQLMADDDGKGWQRDQPKRFRVPRLSLYWFRLDAADETDPAPAQDRFGIAILAVEIAKSDEPLPVQYIQELLDRFRRIYPPYFEYGQGRRIPHAVQWLDGDGKPCDGAPPARTDDKRCLDWVNKHHNYPVLEHWRWLLNGVWTEAESARAMAGLTVMEDERLPLMAWIGCAEPRALSRQDFVRLCYADAAGPSNSYPYAPGYLESFEQNHCYDRYWVEHPAGDHDWMSTRFMNSGYAFICVGKDEPDYYANDATGLLSHFRNHYFLMGLILHFQKTALLAFSDRLSENVARLAKEKNQGMGTAKAIRRDLLHFTSRYWFLDLTSQTQGQELHDHWRRQLKLPALHEQVMAEARELNEWLDMETEQQLARTTARLTTVATLGLTAGLIMATLGANDWFENLVVLPGTGSTFWNALINALIVGGCWYLLTRYAVKRSHDIHLWLEKLVKKPGK